MDTIKSIEASRNLSRSIKPLIGCIADLKCHDKLCMRYLARDRPKMMTKIITKKPISYKIGNEGMRLLCQTLKESKGAKKISLDIRECFGSLLKILTKNLKASRSIEMLELKFGWGCYSVNWALLQLLSHLKDLKNLKSLIFEIDSGYGMSPTIVLEPFLQLYRLSSLKEFRIHCHKIQTLKVNNSMALLLGIKGLEKLSALDLDFSLLNCLNFAGDVQEFIKHLKRVQNLCSLRLDFTKSNQYDPKLLDEILSYLSSLHSLRGFYLDMGHYSYLGSEFVAKLVTSLANNSGLKTLELFTNLRVTPNHKKSLADVYRFNLKGVHQLTSLKIHLSNYSEQKHDETFKDLALILESNPLLKKLDLSIRIPTINTQNFKSLSQGLQSLKSLSDLKLSLPESLDSDGELILLLTDSLKTLKTLSNLYLNLNYSFMTSCDIIKIAEAIDSLQGLNSLFIDISYPKKPQPQAQSKKGSFSFFSLFTKKKEKQDDKEKVQDENKDKYGQTGLASFGPVFHKHKNLSSITLHIMGLQPDQEELGALASGIEALKSLKSFGLHYNQPKEKDKPRLDFSNLYRSLENVSSLGLKFSRVSPKEMETLAAYLGGMSKLKTLELCLERVDSLSLHTAENFVEAIKSLRKLRHLNLNVHWANDIDMKLALRFADVIKNLGYLSESSWRFTGLHCQSKFNKVLRNNLKDLRVLSSPNIRYQFESRFDLDN